MIKTNSKNAAKSEVITKCEIKDLSFPVDGFRYNVQIWRSVDGGKNFAYCGDGKYFRHFGEAEKWADEMDGGTRFTSRMWKSCKSQLLGTAHFLETHTSGGRALRFNGIQWQCQFYDIDPVQMAGELMREGMPILFDDSSISRAENEKNRRKVEKAASI